MKSPRTALQLILTFFFLLISQALAQSPGNVSDDVRQDQRTKLTRLNVHGFGSRYNDLLHVAESSSQGSVGKEIFESRPLFRPGEIIETVPGMIATQHAGDGKANQYFFRGFNLDHGTDFRTEVEGMPVNLTTHGHGQGYTDLHFLIPELVDFLDYNKGSYATEKGNFATAGSVDFHLQKQLSAPLAKITVGENDLARFYSAGSTKLGNGDLLGALELSHYNGPWDVGQDARRLNAVLRYSTSSSKETFDITGMAYRGIWNSSDQIPQRAVDDGRLSFFGTVDPTTGGNSNRFSLSSTWERMGETGTYNANAYLVYYDLDLYSNFTYFLEDPERGDQFYQEDQRLYFGGATEAEHNHSTFGLQSKLSYGLQLRHDHIPTVALRRTSQRRVTSTIREDEVEETHAGIYVKNDTRFLEWLRGYVGLRGDFAYVDVNSDRQVNSGNDSDAQASPKAGLVFGPWSDTEFYLNGGFSFHSNDARGATTTIDPVTLEEIDTVDLLTEARGAEVGVRTAAVPGLVSTITAWYLELDNELVFVGDAGTTEVLGATERYGIELSNYYQMTDWLSMYADYSYTRPRFKDDSAGEDRIPNSIEHTLVSGVRVGEEFGPFVSGKWRYLGTRPLIEDGSVSAPVTSLVDLRLGHKTGKFEVSLDIFNLLDEDDNDIAYFYASRLPGEAAGGVEDVHFHPVEPRQVRASLTYRF